VGGTSCMVIKIMIVEDERIAAWDLEQRLTSWGYEIIGIAASGKDALKLVKTNKIDLF
jgi:Response regulator containing CheY-like receiver domain and AraC-type DNA-binding domain